MGQPVKTNPQSLHLEHVNDRRQLNKQGNDDDIANVAEGEQVSATHLENNKSSSAAIESAQLPHDDEYDDPIPVTPADNARVLRKIDLRILPLILFVYCLQSLDKTSLSYASVFGLISDTNLVGDQFSWLGSVVYVAQLVFQPLIAYSLVKFPIGKFSGIMVLCWGAVLCGMTAATNFAGLMAARLLLGMFEASVGRSKQRSSKYCVFLV